MSWWAKTVLSTYDMLKEYDQYKHEESILKNGT